MAICADHICRQSDSCERLATIYRGSWYSYTTFHNSPTFKACGFIDTLHPVCIPLHPECIHSTPCVYSPHIPSFHSAVLYTAAGCKWCPPMRSTPTPLQCYIWLRYKTSLVITKSSNISTHLPKPTFSSYLKAIYVCHKIKQVHINIWK